MTFAHITINWKTSLAGLAAIFGGLAKAFGEYQQGGVSAVNLGTLLTALSIGAGLIVAKDSDVSGQPVKP